MSAPHIVIVGSGPAGVRCAEVLVEAGLRPTVIDESRRDGGQIYRRQPDNFQRPYASLYGTEAGRAADLHGGFEALRTRIDYLPDTLVWNIAERQLYAISADKQITLPFDAVVLCTGATDRLMPVKGWDLPGAYSLGGAQIALKSQACAIGQRIVFMGTGPLLYLVAAQYVKAGAHLAATLDVSPSVPFAAAGKLLSAPSTLWKGILLRLSLRGAGVPVYTDVNVLEIQGTPDAGVQGISFRHRGQVSRIDCDAVGMGYHLRPETQLADLARCEFHFDPLTRQWLPQTDEDGRTSVPGVYVAGDGARVLGAAAAEISGRLAGWAILKDLAMPAHSPRPAQRPPREIAAARRERARLERFAQGLTEAFPWPAQRAAQLPDDTILCRCEAVTVGELRAIVRNTDAREINRGKAFSRVGMGRCQGRYCGHAAAEVIAQTAGVPVEHVGRLRSQAPVKPLPVRVET